MKTLYLSDLDGTLINSDQRISPYTAGVINDFVDAGGYFSYATARSIVTSSKVAAGFNARLPVICANGAFILDPSTREILVGRYFAQADIDFAREIITEHGLFPHVFTYIDNTERLLIFKHEFSTGFQNFLDERKGDPRFIWLDSPSQLYQGNIFAFHYINEKSKLEALHEAFGASQKFYTVFQKDVYSDDSYLEIMPKDSTKATAALELKKMLGCDRLVVFGDGLNDMPMFEVADESYAMANAHPELKSIATAVIDSNTDDGVAKWINAHGIKSHNLGDNQNEFCK